MRDELLAIADQIRALATTGLHYTEGPFDRERYEKLLELAARLAAHGAGDEPAAMLRLFRAADDGYVTPKLDVRLALFRADEVLLVRERMDGRWSLPGGFVDVGDSPSDAAVREAVEEAGVVARVERLAGVFDTRLQPDCPPHLFHIHKLVFIGRLVDPDGDAARGQRGDRRGVTSRSPPCPSSRSAAPCRSTCARRCASRATPPHCHTSTDGRRRSPRSRRLRARRLPVADLGGAAPTRSGVATHARRGRRVLGRRAPRRARRGLAAAARLRLGHPA